MAITQTIPRTTLPAGQTIFNLTATAQEWLSAVATINRTGTPSGDPWLNNLTAADLLTIDIQYSPDGGASWIDIASGTWNGGVYITKGVLTDHFDLYVGIGHPFPANTNFRVIATATTATTVSGIVVYQ